MGLQGPVGPEGPQGPEGPAGGGGRLQVVVVEEEFELELSTMPQTFEIPCGSSGTVLSAGIRDLDVLKVSQINTLTVDFSLNPDLTINTNKAIIKITNFDENAVDFYGQAMCGSIVPVP